MTTREDAVWQPDVLGSGFECLELPLAQDTEGAVVATLVRHRVQAGTPAGTPGPGRRPEGGGPLAAALRRRLCPDDAGPAASPAPAAPPQAILYLHGWADYFLQAELAEHLGAEGLHFYALDLRKFGRSLRDWQSPGDISDLADYDEDIAAAMAAIAADLALRTGRADAPAVHLVAHSFGGLVAALWAERHPGELATLILNAPWLELQGSSLIRTIATRLVDLLARTDPHQSFRLPNMPGYWESVSREAHGEWELDPRWRPTASFPIRAGWTKAVLAGHALVEGKLDIQEPVLIMLAGRTRIQAEWSEELMGVDAVIDVEETARRALGLGRRTSIYRYPGAIHDIFLSRRGIRREAYRDLVQWLRACPG
ncbi:MULTISPECIES: alpha/beta hydrolase [Arthrobacter]|uniref:Alpha/beta hydrolase n=1 Tax=Arthrobacter oryzae TaxID=409290 RepID=A0A3N0C764_9MICC|nr:MULTISPECIES: alpha/beta hydrolase [Arthrobacter]QYF90164.1 alpha/beta hydrolase [Arthrobacter sp. PAMC25284]RNL58368.1 alpha/beta hydrolase [Arthrobacter oryzae]